jgi:hypothetical protein
VRRVLECCICGHREAVGEEGFCVCRHLRVCRQCDTYTPHVVMGLVTDDGRFFGFRNLGELLDELLGSPAAGQERERELTASWNS